MLAKHLAVSTPCSGTAGVRAENWLRPKQALKSTGLSSTTEGPFGEVTEDGAYCTSKGQFIVRTRSTHHPFQLRKWTRQIFNFGHALLERSVCHEFLSGHGWLIWLDSPSFHLARTSRPKDPSRSQRSRRWAEAMLLARQGCDGGSQSSRQF